MVTARAKPRTWTGRRHCSPPPSEFGLPAGFVTGIAAISSGEPPREVTMRADHVEFSALVCIDTPDEAAYYRHGGIMPYVLRSLLHPAPADAAPG